jgi:hypothetical protein
MTVWKPMDSAPKSGCATQPVAILLFLPGVWTKFDPDNHGHALAYGHGRAVGWWDATQNAWVCGFHPNEYLHVVYPAMWTDLPDMPKEGQ